MRDALIVFAAQYVYVMLLGLQSINVNSRLMVLSATVSGFLGVLGFELTASIARAQEMYTLVWWAYISAGPCGICTSIYLQPKIQRMYERAVGKYPARS